MMTTASAPIASLTTVYRRTANLKAAHLLLLLKTPEKYAITVHKTALFLLIVLGGQSAPIARLIAARFWVVQVKALCIVAMVELMKKRLKRSEEHTSELQS